MSAMSDGPSIATFTHASGLPTDPAFNSLVMASNLLWAHLLRKDATTTDSSSQIPPIAPQDKTGTSMRMLIHDTQANLEKFSTRLDGLFQRVEDCRAQVVNANKLLDVERDKVLTQILEIAHRCQSELKTHLGTPAQAPTLDLVHVSQVSTDKSVQALEKRIDALQALLQSQSHAMQSIQDQQNTLMGAILPLVTVLNAVPPQMDLMKVAVSDMVANAVSTMTSSVENIRSTLAQGHGCTATWAGSSTRCGSRRKRSDVSVLRDVAASSPLDSRDQGGPRLSVKRARPEGGTHRVDNAHPPRKLSRLAVPLTNSSGLPPLPQTPRTPRQPLADLPILPETRTRHDITSRLDSTSDGYMRPSSTPRPRGDPSTSVGLVSGLPFELPDYAPSDLQEPTTTRRSPGSHDRPSTVDNSTTRVSSAARASDRLKAIKTSDILEPKPTDVISIHSSSLSSAPSSLSHVESHDPGRVGTNVIQPSTQQRPRPPDDMHEVAQVQLFQPLPSSSDPFSSHPDGSPPKSMSLRDRRAQMSKCGRTETRRFIPLVPWSDEEE